MKKNLKYYLKKTIALTLAAAMLGPIMTDCLTVYAKDPLSCERDHNWTGLHFTWTNIYDANGGFLGWPRKLYFYDGEGEWKSYAGKYVYCIANHTTGQPQKGSEAIAIQLLKVADYDEYAGNKDIRNLYDKSGNINMKKFTFCLAAAAAMNAYHGTTLADCKDYTSTTYLYGLAQSMFIAIEGRLDLGNPNYGIMSANKEQAYKVFCNCMEREFYMTTTSGKQLNSVVKGQMTANRRKFFDDCWSGAEVMYNGMQDTSPGQTVANTMTASADPSNPTQYIMNFPCSKDAWDTYYKKIKLTKETQNGWKFVNEKYDDVRELGIITFEKTNQTAGNPQFNFEEKGTLTDLSEPVLCEFNFCTLDFSGNPNHENYQTLFGAYYKEPTFTVLTGPSQPEGGGGPKGDSEGSIKLEIHRYKHTEDWQTNYNIDLIKNDSETGKPLSGSKWDVLEYDTLGEWSDGGSQLGSTYLDHPVEAAGAIGTNYNWANDNGTQFTRWEEDEEDPCTEDLNVTGEDGYLYDANTLGDITGTKAHRDTYNYTYTKGYCTGHPKPEITPYEGSGKEVEEKNEELEKKAEEAWQEQVDYCEKLAAEGGFFHTAEESISDAAKNEMQADRDKFFDDYISLTYDYSAEEVGARTGYILHDLHTDDIPVERVVIHSSEYLNLKSGATEGNDADTESLEPGVLSVSDEEMSADEVRTRTAKKAVKITKAEDDNSSSVSDVSENIQDTASSESAVSNDAAANSLPAASADESADNTDEEEITEDTAITGDAAVNDEPTDSDDAVGDDGSLSALTATDSNAYATDDPDYDPDIEILDDGIIDDEDSDADTDEAGNVATPSEYKGVKDEVVPEEKNLWNILKEGFNYAMERVAAFFAGFFSDDSDDDIAVMSGGYARNDSSGPVTDGVTYIGNINFETSDVAEHEPGTHDTECWTFIAYDHRTEGEIHFKKF